MYTSLSVVLLNNSYCQIVLRPFDLFTMIVKLFPKLRYVNKCKTKLLGLILPATCCSYYDIYTHYTYDIYHFIRVHNYNVKCMFKNVGMFSFRTPRTIHSWMTCLVLPQTVLTVYVWIHLSSPCSHPRHGTNHISVV